MVAHIQRQYQSCTARFPWFLLSVLFRKQHALYRIGVQKPPAIFSFFFLPLTTHHEARHTQPTAVSQMQRSPLSCHHKVRERRPRPTARFRLQNRIADGHSTLATNATVSEFGIQHVAALFSRRDRRFHDLSHMFACVSDYQWNS
jgi:hypothetical protein